MITQTTISSSAFSDFVGEEAEKAANEMDYLGPVWTMASTKTKVELLCQHFYLTLRNRESINET